MLEGLFRASPLWCSAAANSSFVPQWVGEEGLALRLPSPCQSPQEGASVRGES